MLDGQSPSQARQWLTPQLQRKTPEPKGRERPEQLFQRYSLSFNKARCRCWSVSSGQNDVVLDAFCGCGTGPVVA